MLFNSIDFAAFAAVFFPAWWLLRGSRWRMLFLVAASFFFYGWWDWRFVLLLLASGLVDFLAALGIERRPAARTAILVVSLSTNLGLLALFKYKGLLLEAANQWIWVAGGTTVFEAATLALPPGISFYTFQSMSYTIDVYRGRVKATPSLVDFFAYLSMFPQLVAGPIVRADQILPQIQRPHPVDEREVLIGWSMIARGFFKKCVLADNLAPAVNDAFAHVGAVPSGSYWWVIAAMFAFQIYYDFSGYSDIACGLGRLMGFRLPRNFDHPYVSRSFREFWTRWHISLSTWFRDYLYIPLGGNAKGPLRTYMNLWCTMVLSGLWHGASWTFLVWGAYHAALVSLERLGSRLRRALGIPSPGWLGMPIVFALTLVSWVVFRVESLGDLRLIYPQMFSPDALRLSFDLPLGAQTALAAAIAWEVGAVAARAPWPRLRAWPWRVAVEPALPALLFAAAIYLRGPGSAFIYFQF